MIQTSIIFKFWKITNYLFVIFTIIIVFYKGDFQALQNKSEKLQGNLFIKLSNIIITMFLL